MYCRQPLRTIETIDDLHYNLQLAVELEFSTLPTYLQALYSIKEGSNTIAYSVIRSVIMEEMFHLTNAANVLIATGGSPALNSPEFIPIYPTFLPDNEKWFEARLLKLSPQALMLFLAIEMPGDLVPISMITIGKFYENIEKGLKYLDEKMGADLFPCGTLDKQIEHKYYYGGGGIINKVTNLDSALFALNAIIAQGEGAPNKHWDPDKSFPLEDTTGIESGDHQLFMQPRELSHFYRFNELKKGRRYVLGDSHNSGPTGPEININYDDVYNLKPDPQSGDYIHYPELEEMNFNVNVIFSRLLDQLHLAFNGQPKTLETAVCTMFSLKEVIQILMRNPIPDNELGEYAAPTWEYLSPEERTLSSIR
ncbi:ferritin-like domain-containing protein [Shewanella surugensis]|uniref:Ferritin-like protein n=1 Tax=Shewanella surugensis TaxID=212020 RepID=A0ABT0L9S2_9GAMM|nr:ferritin-like protein [Shewanella surugensis]MCL1124105.1 ferritin-like protein [Shewanella surugensis]